MPPEYKKENTFIINCLTGVLLNTISNEKVSDPGQINWDYLITTAELNGVIPLLSKSFNFSHKDVIPEDVLETVSEINRDSAVSNLIKLKELININVKLNESDIKTIVLKGPGLGADTYNDISLRPFGDLDILVHKIHVPDAVNILRDNGYEYSFDLSDKQIELYMKSPLYLNDQDMHYSFYNPVKKIYLELHWALMPEKYSFSQDVEDIFSNSVSVSTGQGNLIIPGNEDLILYLSIHGAKHFWSRLIWIFDIAAFIHKKKNMNWELVIAKSEELNCRRILLLSVHLAKKMFCVEVPGVFTTYINKDKTVPELADKVAKNFADIYDLEYAESENKTFFLNSMESVSDKTLYILDLIFKPTINEAEVIILPKSLFFLYYFIRPARLLKKYVLKVISNR